MTITELILMGIGLSMDAVAVSMTNGMVYKNTSKGKLAAQPMGFGAMQGLMPLLGGILAGGLFAETIAAYGGIIIFAILGVIGFKMVKDGIATHKEEVCIRPAMTYKLLFFQGIATSVDAFAVGIGLKLLGVDLPSAAVIIAVTTFTLVIAAMLIGKKFGDYLGYKAEILGGIILILIGIKAIIL